MNQATEHIAQGYGFLSFARKFGKTTSKRIVQKAGEATRDLIGNKIADKITLVGKSKNKQKKDKMNEMNETEEIYIPPEKRKQIINDLRLF